MTPEQLRQRFWERVDASDSDGCWLWTSTIGYDGYGTMYTGTAGKRTRAHRVSWVLHNGTIPDGLVVRHICDNRPCVRPDHLLLGTVLDNNRDRDERGRGNITVAVQAASAVWAARRASQTHCHRGHELTPENSYSDRPGGPRCCECRRLLQRQRYWRAKDACAA